MLLDGKELTGRTSSPTLTVESVQFEPISTAQITAPARVPASHGLWEAKDRLNYRPKL
jgi:hypothetical protein